VFYSRKEKELNIPEKYWEIKIRDLLQFLETSSSGLSGGEDFLQEVNR